MSEMFIVTTGYYSDYRIVAVFDDRSIAETFCKPRQGQESEMTVEPFELNPDKIAIRAGWTVYRVEMRRDGSLCDDIEIVPEKLSKAGTGELWGSPLDGYHYLEGYILAKNEQHAIKIINEQRAQRIALGKWPEDSEQKPPPPPLAKEDSITRLVPGFLREFYSKT